MDLRHIDPSSSMSHVALRKSCFAMVSIAVLFLAGCSKKAANEAANEEKVATVDSSPVVNGAIQQKIAFTAVVFPFQQSAIVPKVGAPVKKFYVERGSRVHAGQLLAELESQDLTAAAAENRANLAQAQAAFEVASRGTLPEDLQKAELEVKAAKEMADAQKKVYDSRSALFKEGALAEKEVNDALVALTQARNQLEIAQKHLDSLKGFGNEQEMKAAAAQLDAAKAKRESAEAQLGYTRITSPIDGVVTDRPLFPGEMASGSVPIVTVMDVSKVIARAHISQVEAARIKAGNDATIAVPGQDGSLKGKVTIISPALDPESTTVEVWIQAANPDMRVKPGSSVRIEVVTESLADALLIPTAALLTGDDGSTFVFAIDAANKPHKKHVTVGIRDSEEVQVLDGVQSGERVVTAGSFELSKMEPEDLAKTKVKVQSMKEEEEDEDEDK